ncbi:MAG TPA: cytosolic protein [Bacillaceae bacterium]
MTDIRRNNDNRNQDNIKYTDVSNVETQRNYIIPEQTPEGPYGAPRGEHTPVENKSTPWREGQRSYSAFNYEFKSMHQNMQRKFPGSHPTHADPKKDTQSPYQDS